MSFRSFYLDFLSILSNASETLFTTFYRCGIFEYYMLCFHLSLFNFQSAIRCLSLMLHNSLAATARLLYHIFSLLSSTFSKFLEVFQALLFCTYLLDSLIIISQTFRFVKGFFKSFLSFLLGVLCDSMVVASHFHLFFFRSPQTVPLLYHLIRCLSTLFDTLLPFNQSINMEVYSFVDVLHNS